MSKDKSALDTHVKASLIVITEERDTLNYFFCRAICDFDLELIKLGRNSPEKAVAQCFTPEFSQTKSGDIDAVWCALSAEMPDGPRPWGRAIHRSKGAYKYSPSRFRRASEKERELIEIYEQRFAIIRRKLSILHNLYNFMRQYEKLLDIAEPSIGLDTLGDDRI